ncbi:MAG: hypothetical protein H6921_15185 [Sphingomonas sp.]|nr:hypothetical protein [Sphingomonas sp.]
MDGIDDDRLATRVDSFYTRARTEDRLAQTFNEAISDWPERLKKNAATCSSILLTSDRYKGQSTHRKVVARITPELFDRWLDLWSVAIVELTAPPAAAMLPRPFLPALVSALSLSGVASDRIHYEFFGPTEETLAPCIVGSTSEGKG